MQGRGKFYEEVGALRDVIENHLFQTVGAARDGAAGRARASRSCATARRSVFGAMRDAQARRPRARPVRGLPRRARGGARLRRRDVRRRAPAHRLVALGGRAVLRPGRARTSRCTCTEVRVELHRPPHERVRRVRAAAPRHELLPLPAQPAASRSRSVSRVKALGRRLPSARTSSCTSATTIPARRRRTSGCSATRWTARRCCSPARTASSRRGGWSTTCSPTTAPRSRTTATAGAPRSSTGCSRTPRSLARARCADSVTVEPVPTPSAPPVAGPYSPAVRAGDCVVLAGQVGIGGDGKLVAGGIEPETAQVLANIRAVLDDCGGSWADVARAAIFLTDLGNFAAVNALYEGAIGAHRPARTTVGVAGLPAGARQWRSSAGRTCHEESDMTDQHREDRRPSGGRS